MLMDANYGYSKFQTNKKGGGWPALQVQLMLELVGTSRKMNQFDAAVIHLTRLLDVMFLHLQVFLFSFFHLQICLETTQNFANLDTYYFIY